MAITAQDVQICLCKMIKVSSQACFIVSTQHPYITSCLLFLLLLYLFCPLFFWIVICSAPLAASAWVYIAIRDRRRRNEERENERETKTKFEPPPPPTADVDDCRRKKAFSRVHSVRRRRAKEIVLGDDKTNAVSTPESNRSDAATENPNADTTDKTASHEGNHEFYYDSELMRSLKLLSDDEDKDEANKAMDVGISDAERTKRLENLIARRKSRKMLSSQVRRTLMNMDPASPIPPMVIPKVNTRCSPSRAGVGPFSPAPGSAPSVLVPMRNPFDLPYDPQEEKLDLSGDTFGQEFKVGHNRDLIFCRHESFSLGTSLPLDFFDGDETTSVDDLGFRRRRSSIGYNFPKQESDTDFGPTTDADSSQESESKSNVDSPDDDDNEDDQIKEVIHEQDNVAKNHNTEGGPTTPNEQHESSSSLNSSSGSSSHDSSEDERPVRIINREAILKSLSMRRNTVPDIDIITNDNLQDNNLSYANSALENASRLKQQYYADKPQKRHGMTFSIASDMQVEVSEVSSPPLTIEENMSYRDDGEMDRNASWDGLDSWAGSSRLSEVEDNETRPTRAPPEAGGSGSRRRWTTPQPNTIHEKHMIHSSSPSSSSSSSSSLATESSENGESHMTNNQTLESCFSDEVVEASASIENTTTTASAETAQREEGEASSTNEATTIDPPQEQPLMQNTGHQTTISPKSVLQPTLSVASFDPEPDPDDEAQQTRNPPPNPTPLVVQFTVANGEGQGSQESSGPSSASTSGAKYTAESSNGKQKILEDEGGSSSKTTEESGQTHAVEEASGSKDVEAANLAAPSKNLDEKAAAIQESTHNGEDKENND